MYIEFWNCSEIGCVTKFIRWEYLSKHLSVQHRFAKYKAHEAACLAPRGDVQRDTYYDNKNEDDVVFDIIAETNDPEYNNTYMDTAESFDSGVFDGQLD